MQEPICLLVIAACFGVEPVIRVRTNKLDHEVV